MIRPLLNWIWPISGYIDGLTESLRITPEDFAVEVDARKVKHFYYDEAEVSVIATGPFAEDRLRIVTNDEGDVSGVITLYHPEGLALNWREQSAMNAAINEWFGWFMKVNSIEQDEDKFPD